MRRQSATKYDKVLRSSGDSPTFDQEGALFLGHLQNPVLSPISTNSNGEEVISNRRALNSLLTTGDFEEDSTSSTHSRSLRVRLPAIKEDPREDQYQHRHTTSLSTASTISRNPSRYRCFASSPPVLPSPSSAQTLLQHLKEAEKEKGFGTGVGAEPEHAEDAGDRNHLEKTLRLLLSSSQTNRLSFAVVQRLADSGSVPDSSLMGDVFSDIKREIDDLMASFSQLPPSLVQGDDELQRAEKGAVTGALTGVKRNPSQHGASNFAGGDLEMRTDDDDLTGQWVRELGDRGTWANVVEDLTDFFKSNQIDVGHWSAEPGDTQQRIKNGSIASADSGYLSTTAEGKKTRMAVPIRLQRSGTASSSDTEPNMRGGGPPELPFLPRPGSRRNPPFIPKQWPEPEAPTEISFSPSVKSSNRTSLTNSLLDAAHRQRYGIDGEESVGDDEGRSPKDTVSYVSSCTSHHGRFGGNTEFKAPVTLSQFPPPPNESSFEQSLLRKVPPSPMRNTEFETSIPTPTLFARKKSLMRGERLAIPGSNWESEADTKANTRPTADVNRSEPHLKPPYPAPINSLQTNSDYERESRMDNPTSSNIKNNNVFEYSKSGPKTAEHTNDRPLALSTPPRRADAPVNAGPGSSSPASSVTGHVRGKGFDLPLDLSAHPNSLPNLASPWNSPVQKSFRNEHGTLPPTSNVEPLSPVSDGSSLSSWNRKGHKDYRTKRVGEAHGGNTRLQTVLAQARDELSQIPPNDDSHQVTDRGCQDPNAYKSGSEALERVDSQPHNTGLLSDLTPPQALHRPLGYNSEAGPGDSFSEPTERDPAIAPSEEPFQSVSQKGGFQGQLAEEGRRPSVIPSVNKHLRDEVTQKERSRVLADYQKKQDGWKREHNRFYQEYLQEMNNAGKAANADFQEEWKLRAIAMGFGEADVSRMIQEATEHLVAEQQRAAPHSSLHRLGRRLNKTMKLVLAVPSDPHVKTYSKSHPHPLTREMPLPYGVGTLGFQGRVPAAGATRSRPATAGSQRTVNRPKQSGEISRRPSVPAALQTSYHVVQTCPQARPNDYRESDATLWDPYHPMTKPQSPVCKPDQPFSTTFSDEGILMPSQQQSGNSKWDRALPTPPGIYTPCRKAAMGSVKLQRQMEMGNVRGPSPKYAAASVKSFETTAIPTQPRVYMDEHI